MPVMLGAIVMVHWGRWNCVPTPSHRLGGMELQVVLLSLGLWLSARWVDALSARGAAGRRRGSRRLFLGMTAKKLPLRLSVSARFA